MKRWSLVCVWLGALMLLGGAQELETVRQAGAWTESLPARIKYVALTFDDGPRSDTTAQLLDGLRSRGASATFFVVGERAAANPELVARMKQEGHQVGSHTWSHTWLQGAPDATVLTETSRAQAALEDILGPGAYWMRPPYGLLDERQQALFQVPLVRWSVDPKDWESRDTQAVVEAVLASIEENDIVLLHDIYPTSVAAALEIIDRLTPQGYRFVTVEELLVLNGVEPAPGTFYSTGKG